MNVRENPYLNLQGDFDVDVDVPDGTAFSSLRIVPSGSTAENAALQVEVSLASMSLTARVCVDGVWTTL